MAPNPETFETSTDPATVPTRVVPPDPFLSPHFRLSEFRDKRNGEVRVPPPQLLDVLERIRELRPGPLKIISAYRSPATNRAVGGAKRSQHLFGRAVDIPPGRATQAEAIAAGATGVGTSGRWAVHVDVRPGPVTTWSY